jgi:hypothetical protein
MRRSRTLEHCAALLVGLLAACGGDDGGPAPECETELAVEVTVDLETVAEPPQIHADVAFDGSAIWLVYNLQDGEGGGGFDVFLRRIHCDGSPASESMRVTTTLGGNDVDPAIAIRDEVIAVVWNADNGTGANNMDVLFRTWGVDGEPVMDTDVILETEREGAPVTGNVMSPAVAAAGEEQFAVVGVRGLEAAGTFQTFVQYVDADGNLAGPAIDGYFDVGASHRMPTVAAAADGSLYLSWARGTAADDENVVHTRLLPGAASVDPTPPLAAMAGARASAPSHAAGSDGQAYLAFQLEDDEEIALVDGSRLDGSATSIVFGATGRLDHTPTVAAATGGGAVAWHRNVSGFRNQVLVRSFAFDGAAFAPGVERVLDTENAGPYAPAITHIRDNVYFVVWSEGPSPDFCLKGRFVQLD